MNTYRIVRVANGFRAIEVSLDGREDSRHFQTEAVAQVWIVKRATVANWANLTKWLNPTWERSGW
jgi:hypothetical protein